MLDGSGQGEGAREVGGHRNDLDRGKKLLQLGRALLEIVAGDIDRHVSGRLHSLEEDRSFGLGAGAELDHDARS